jgi:hypothetical protein
LQIQEEGGAGLPVRHLLHLSPERTPGQGLPGQPTRPLPEGRGLPVLRQRRAPEERLPQEDPEGRPDRSQGRQEPDRRFSGGCAR